jgi:undecaprenyl diphosphate synthase
MIWQGAYSEWVFSPVLWPDFTKEDLRGAIIEYGRRERRFGKV